MMRQNVDKFGLPDFIPVELWAYQLVKELTRPDGTSFDASQFKSRRLARGWNQIPNNDDRLIGAKETTALTNNAATETDT